jgi:hypothetical protein
MAEVRVEGGGELDGAILKGAATEATLQQLIKVMQTMAAGTKAAAAVQKAAKGKGTGAQDLGNLRKEVDETTNQFEKLTNRSKAATSAIYDFGKTALISGQKFGDFTQSITSFMATAGPGFFILGGGIQALVNETDRQVQVFRQLSTAGADFGAGIFGSRMASIEAGLTLDTFATEVMANTDLFSRLGGNVNIGTRTFTRLSRTIQSDFQPILSRLGFTMEETSNYVTDYLEIMTGLGQAQVMSDAELAQGSREYLLQLDQLSRVTGMSRKAASDELKRQQADTRLKSLMQGMDKQGQANLQQIIAGLGQAPDDIKNAITDMIVTGGNPVGDFAKMLASRNQELVGLAAGVKRGTVSVEEFAAGIRRAAVNAKSNTADLEQLAVAATLSGNKMFDSQGQLVGLINYQAGAAEATKEQREAQEAATKSITNFDSQLTKLRNSLIVLISPLLEFTGFLLSSFSYVITGLTTLVGYLVDGFKNLVNPYLQNVLDALEPFGQAIKIVTGLLMAYGAVMMARSVGGKLMGGAAKLLSGGGTAASVATAAPAAAKTGGMLSAGGSLLSGATMLAAGKAIAVVTLAVAALGAILAGVSYLIGAGLGKIGSGLEKIAGVDSEKLKLVAEASSTLADSVLKFNQVDFGTIGKGTSSFAKNINDTLKSLDKDKLISYTETLTNLSESFAGLNKNMSASMDQASKSSANKMDELNMTMQRVLTVLQDSKRIQKDTSVAIDYNI